MTNRFFEPGEQRAARVNELFDSISTHYDLINDVQSLGLHRLWKRRVIDLARVTAGDRALDLCCGTGDIALSLARCGAEVVGLDFSQRMLDVAEARRSKDQIPKSQVQHRQPELRSQKRECESDNPKFLRGDAERIPFSDNSFDIVTVGYGLRNLASWETGLREMQRVAKPGGRLVVLDFGKPDNALWRGLYFGYLKLLVPLLGRVLCGDVEAYSYILESLKQYPGQRGVEAKMHELRLGEVKVVNLLGGAMSINYAEKRGDLKLTRSGRI
jgi:demethylmenaquinone methyltransferase/2-methoxy-6-polyprenyl-1,4-benzoquinol methylase